MQDNLQISLLGFGRADDLEDDLMNIIYSLHFSLCLAADRRREARRKKTKPKPSPLCSNRSGVRERTSTVVLLEKWNKKWDDSCTAALLPLV